jgi:serine O-acetyltransferase
MTPSLESLERQIPTESPALTVDPVPSKNRGDRNLNPAGIGFLALLGEDLRTHDNNTWEQGFWAIAVHRLGNWRMGFPRFLRAPLTIIYRILYRWVEWTCGISLPYTVQLGRRVRIWHHSGIILNARSIGDDVHIRQNTTFGLSGRDQPADAIPTIENRVDIGCNVCVAGAVTIGHDSRVGANTLVIADLPPGSVAVGVPAQILRRLPLPEAGENRVRP